MFCKTFQHILVFKDACWPFLTHCRIDSFRVLKQSFCGKLRFSADFSVQLIHFFGRMSNTKCSGARASHLWRDPVCGRPAWRGHYQSEGWSQWKGPEFSFRWSHSIILMMMMIWRWFEINALEQVSRKLFPLAFLATSVCYWWSLQ